jgi:adenylyltransferase/sulfurtransferase
MQELTVQELDKMRRDSIPHMLLDVRENDEYSVGHISGSKHIPLGELPTRLTELPKDQRLVVQCKSGARSSKAVALLEGKGFTNLWNLKGGILAWARDIDPSIQVL